MPAAIRIDIHLTHVRDSNQRSGEARKDVKGLAAMLSDVIRDAIIEWSGGPRQQEEKEDDSFLNPTIHPGLGPVWPRPEKPEDPRPIGEGGREYIERLATGEDTRTLMRVEAYDDGAFHVYFSADLS